ncbi:MAG: carbamoyltransferase [Bacteroidales bacterium]|nr:carbamoyltransferase [Bacteroidales bacterium]
MNAVLGISAYYHDSAAALLIDGNIIAAAQEERFTRIKHDASFPHHAIEYVLHEGGLKLEDLEVIVFYEKPFLKFERLLETYHAFAPKGLKSFISAIPVWIKEKLFMKKMLKDELSDFGKLSCPIWFPEHHLSHAASAFYPSPFDKAAILTIDGVGEWATSTIGLGSGNQIEILKELHFPHSLGLLYSAFTYYTGFRVNSGEYKLMGLAPYGDEKSPQTQEFKNKILQFLVDVREDGSIILNMEYFEFATGLKMTKNKKWEALFGLPPRLPESELSQDYMNLALAIQQVTEDVVLRMAKHASEITDCKKLVLAGGVALNCVANGKLLKSGLFEDIWIQPAAGDAGGALGAALAGWYIGMNKSRTVEKNDSMHGAMLGPEFSNKDITRTITKYGADFEFYNDFENLCTQTADLLSQGKVVGWFQGRMEFGPRALGNRSILGDARNPDMQRKLNLKIKYREGFRPFAPIVTEDKVSDYFELIKSSPYMLMVAPVKKTRCIVDNGPDSDKTMLQRLYHLRSDIPAVTHIDYSARIQTVHYKTNTRLYKLLKTFGEKNGYEVLVNTSFNVRGEPIVCTPDDAFRCFMSTEMDYLVMGDYLFSKEKQPKIAGIIKGAKNLD